MFVVYAKDDDDKIACSDRYQETEFLGVYSTIELANQQIECHKIIIQERLKDKKKITPKYWIYHIFSCELDHPVILDESKCCI